MAEGADDSQKTEEPSGRKLARARDKGQVVQSREIHNWFMIGTSLGLIYYLSGPAARSITSDLLRYVEMPHQYAANAALWRAVIDTLENVAMTFAVPLALLVVAAIAGTVSQIGLLVAAEKIHPSIGNLSPAKGFSRMFSARGLVEFLKTLLKVVAVAAVAAMMMRPEVDRLPSLSGMDAATLLAELWRLVVRLAFGVFCALTLIAIFDYAYQKFSFTKTMRMSKQEVKEEHKQSEGDPMVRARLRQIRMERARKRMMAAVPSASVVVTNPTHVAVALKYELGGLGAPKVVAKGAELMAQRIREIAREHDVPIVENPPLARALYGSVEVDQEIPAEHYKAVAQIIGYVFRQQGKIKPSAAPPPQPT
jgi:flagellar biosynthesis protein FlhB